MAMGEKVVWHWQDMANISFVKPKKLNCNPVPQNIVVRNTIQQRFLYFLFEVQNPDNCETRPNRKRSAINITSLKLDY